MPLTIGQTNTMATTAAAATERLPRRMDQHCMQISQALVAAMPPQVPAVTVGYIALRWYTPNDSQRSHVAVYLMEGGASFVVDASWQQYPFVARMQKYSDQGTHSKLSLNARLQRASDKAENNAIRIHVATPNDWQGFIENFNSIGLNRISRRVFQVQQDASDWMAFRT